MRSSLRAGGAPALVMACLLAASSATAADCTPKLLRPKALRIVKPLLELRIKQQADQFTEDGHWKGESSLTPEVYRRFGEILKDRTPAGDQAVAYLLTVYMGEDNGEAIVCEVINRGRRMLPLIRAVQRCQPLTGLEPLPRFVQGSGALVDMALEALKRGDKPCVFD